jgi:hypothetical protein
MENKIREEFDRMKPPKHASLGGLIFDEVKINEGLVFDHKNWELVKIFISQENCTHIT